MGAKYGVGHVFICNSRNWGKKNTLDQQIVDSDRTS